MNRLNIAFVITRADAVGGATVHVRDLAAALIAAGHRATVLVGGEGAVTRQLEGAGIPFVSLRRLRRSVNPVHDLLAVRELAAAIREIGPDLVSAHTAKAGCLARLAGAKTGVPVIYTPHGWTIGDRLSAAQGFVYRQVERRMAPLSAAIVNVCEYERALALKHGVGFPGQHRVIHNGMPDVSEELRADPRREPCRIVMVARFEEPKDHATLLKALAGLRRFRWDLELVGDGPGEPAVRKLTEDLRLGGRVRFRGAVASAAPVLAEAQAFVLSSRSEGFPRSILEAMRAGLPVVASEAGGIPEAVKHGRTGYIVPRSSVTSMQNALEFLIRDPFRRAAFGVEGRREYEARFTFTRMLGETVKVYEQITGTPVETGAREEKHGWQPLPR